MVGTAHCRDPKGHSTGTVQCPKQVITYVASGVTQEFDGINIPRGDGDLIVYTPQYDSDTLTDDSGAEVLVEMFQPDLVPDPGEMITGTVEAIRDGKGSTSLPFDHIVLSASGRPPGSTRCTKI